MPLSRFLQPHFGPLAGIGPFRAEFSAMCHRVKCSRCGKATWGGCGRHVEQALAGVPPEQRCTCPPQKTFVQRILGTAK